MLRELIGDVAGIKIGKDQHIGTAGDLTRPSSLAHRNLGAQRGIGLQFTVDLEGGSALAGQTHGFGDLGDVGVAGAAMGGKRKKRDAGFPGQLLGARSGGDGDAGQFGGGGLGGHGAVGENKAAVAPLHEEKGGRQGNAGL